MIHKITSYIEYELHRYELCLITQLSRHGYILPAIVNCVENQRQNSYFPAYERFLLQYMISRRNILETMRNLLVFTRYFTEYIQDLSDTKSFRQ